MKTMLLTAALLVASPSVLDDMAQGRFDAACARLTPQAAARLNPRILRQAWATTAASIGGFVRFTDVRREPMGAETLLAATMVGQTGTSRAFVARDVEGRVTSLRFDAPHPLESAWEPAADVDTQAFTETAVEVGTGEWALPGTLTTPVGPGPWPVVVLVQGSGPNDRDESIGPNRPFKDWAWGLASRGVAVLRYDKLTYRHGFKLFRRGQLDALTPAREITQGAVEAVALMKHTPRIDPTRVVVLGHSQGGGMLPHIAKAEPGIAGLVSLAGNVEERPEDSLLRQVRYLAPGDEAGLADLSAKVQRVKDGRFDRSTPTADLPLGLSAGFWLFSRTYRPLALLQAYKGPVLVLQGERDYQVLPRELTAWQRALAGRTNATFKLYRTLDHQFRAGVGPSKGADYYQAGHVEETPIADVAGWVKAL